MKTRDYEITFIQNCKKGGFIYHCVSKEGMVASFYSKNEYSLHATIKLAEFNFKFYEIL